jgi:hypothetical protein
VGAAGGVRDLGFGDVGAAGGLCDLGVGHLGQPGGVRDLGETAGDGVGRRLSVSASKRAWRR